ncbi:MAG: IclR family transcriptional regulator [Rhizobiaceae bacterium]|nr:IclR family transcriptional regulator [Rhizobiaceae bacterium]
MATVQNALGLLNLFSPNQPEIGLTQFKNLSGFDKGTTNRYLKSLKSLGFLEQNTETKAYRLGPAIVRLAAIREQTFPVSRVAEIHVNELAGQTGELVHASLYTDNGMSPLYHFDGGISGARVGFDPAEILPLHATSSGIALLAFGAPEILASLSKSKLEKFTSQTDTSFDAVRQIVGKVKELGFAHMSQSYEAEVTSVALPFFDGSGTAIGTISVATPQFRMTEEFKISVLSKAVNTSRAITSEIGGMTPEQLNRKWTLIQTEAEAL